MTSLPDRPLATDTQHQIEMEAARREARNAHLAKLSTKILLARPIGATQAWKIAEDWYAEAEERFTQDTIPED